MLPQRVKCGQVRQGEKVLQIKTDGTWSLIKTDGGVEGYVSMSS